MTMLLRALVIVAVVATTFVDMAMGVNYVVGGPNGGWNLNTQLQAWANTQKFFVGDSLTFVYDATHNVLQVSKPDYDACLTNASIASYSDGKTVITLASPGNNYYICGTLGHCDRGMKVVISVLAASPPPATSPSPPPATSPSVPPAATPSSPKPATPSGSPTASPTSSPVASPPKSTAPTHSPKLSPSVSPSKSPVITPASSPTTPATVSPASSPSHDASSPPTPASSANKISVVTGFTMAVGCIIMMTLTL